MMECGREEHEILREFLEEAELIQYHELFRDILKVTKVSQLKFVVMEDLAHIGLSKPEQRRYKKIYTKYFPNPYISKIKKLLRHKKTDPHNNEQEAISLDVQPFNDCNVKVPTKHIISVEDITINKELGMGQFGVVQQGTWTTGNQRLQVAIKCLGNERMTSNSTEFLKEAAVMHSIEHPNIVRLYGVVLHLDTLMLVTELAPLRSLLECLREVSLRSNFPVPNLCEFAEQICEGMTYLENKRLIHRDLAARNILVFNKDRVKISDFGLSRALGVGKDYYQTNYNVNLKLPVAWCAPECILYLRFTSASDVWAFGVCLWEMFTYGFQPWAAFSGQQILEAIDAPNYQRLEKPECCPESYYTTMMECWSHEPNERPKFKDLGLKLREIRPEQMQAIVNFKKPEEARRNNLLEYKSGQTITVLGKENVTKSPMWYGVLAGGACGLFDPNNTKLFVKTAKSPLPNYPTSITARSPGRLSIAERPTLLRSDLKRHTYTGKRTIQRSMISSPQGEVKHTGHVGLDGAYFGDISFLDPAGCPPRQVVTPYKPSEDLEQMPLINPNSPSHLTADASSTQYPILTSESSQHNGEEFYNAYDNKARGNAKKPTLKPINAPTTSKKILNKVKSAAIGRSFKSDSNHPSTSNDVHEYHEISDTDTESNATETNLRAENFVVPDSPSVPKSNGDFSLSLLEEMEMMFRSLDGSSRRQDDQPSSSKLDSDNIRAHTLGKFEKKRGFHTGTMKPMSAHDQKTLDTAVALANEITTRSMNDLGTESQKVPNSPNDRSKFHFKFPQVPSLKSHSDVDKETVAVKNERRNFSEEAKSVPDIQATLTEESKLAYTSLIEQPTPTTSLISQIAKESINKPSTIPKAHAKLPDNNFSSLRKIERMSPKELEAEGIIRKSVESDIDSDQNDLPLPPRNTKPKLIDKPRHIRKHPLLLPDRAPKINLYENMSCHLEARQNETCHAETKNVNCHTEARNVPCHLEARLDSEKVQYQNIDLNGTDICDGVNTNPFKGVNPFISDLNKEASDGQFDGALVKDCTDHVSVEDLLEFADQKPCGRQRGTESDEVRIMSKVLKQQVTSEECLEALEICDWNVHYAIKVMRVRLATKLATSDLRLCVDALTQATGDVVKASSNILKIQTAE